MFVFITFTTLSEINAQPISTTGETCSNPTVHPGKEGTGDRNKVPNHYTGKGSITPIVCGQNLILCGPFMENFEGLYGSASEAIVETNSEQDKFENKVSCIDKNWLNTNILGASPKNFKIYFGKNGAEDGVVIVPNNNECGDDVGKAAWFPATTTPQCGTPRSTPLSDMKAYVNAYQKVMDEKVKSGTITNYVKSWTYNGAVMKTLMTIHNPTGGGTMEASQVLLEYGMLDNAALTGVNFAELDPIFHFKYPDKDGATYEGAFADWAQPCPQLCPGTSQFGSN